MNLQAWETWLADAREAGMWEEHPRLPDWYERDTLDELAGECQPVAVEEKRAA